MAWTKTVADADRYWSPANRVRGNRWQSFPPEQRQAGFNEAVAQIELIFGGTLSDPSSSDIFRFDFAVFEQALYLLLHYREQEQAGSGATVGVTLKPANDQAKERDRGPGICSQAMRYMGMNQLKMARG